MIQPLSIDVIQKNYQADLNWRMRRHPQWTLNYELSRHTVTTVHPDLINSIRQSNLSITHNFLSNEEAELYVGEASEATP
jgi:hypothetical protein